MSQLIPAHEQDDLRARVEDWLARLAAANPAVAAIDRAEGDEVRWYVRLRGEAKEFTTVWLTLGQRTLRYETYVLPHPEEHGGEVFESLLRRNHRLVGASFSIGEEDAIFLHGELVLAGLTEPELDRAIGTLYDTVEMVFPSLVRVAFASRFVEERKES